MQRYVRDQSETVAEERAKNRPQYVVVDTPVAHNYSSQTLNSTQLALNNLRDQLAQVCYYHGYLELCEKCCQIKELYYQRCSCQINEIY